MLRYISKGITHNKPGPTRELNTITAYMYDLTSVIYSTTKIALPILKSYTNTLITDPTQ